MMFAEQNLSLERGSRSEATVELLQLDQAPPNTFQCRVLVIPDEESGFTAQAIRLPGVFSEGETVEEALENISEAFSAVVSFFMENGQEIPWEPVEAVERPTGAFERWIVVRV